jgi:uncharacterized protein YndB with AHSA1/START domain
MRARVLPALLLLALAAGSVPPARGEETPPSAEERHRLERGEIVYRAGAALRNGVAVSGARGAIAFVRIPTGPAPVWAILTAPREYPRIFPGLRSVQVVEESPGGSLVRTDGKVGPFEFSYYARYHFYAETRVIEWRLDPTRENDVFDDHWGWWRLVPEPGGTLVVYAIGSVPSSWQPLAGYFERRGITRALGALRDAAVPGPRAAATP